MSTVRKAKLTEMSKICRLLSTGLPGWEKPIRYALVHHPNGVWVNIKNETIAGALVVRPEGINDTWIDFLAVAPEFKGQYVGRELLHHAELWLQRAGYDAIKLARRPNDSAAARFYEELGFEKTGELSFKKTIKPLTDPESDEKVGRLRKITVIETLPYRLALIIP